MLPRQMLTEKVLHPDICSHASPTTVRQTDTLTFTCFTNTHSVSMPVQSNVYSSAHTFRKAMVTWGYITPMTLWTKTLSSQLCLVCVIWCPCICSCVGGCGCGCICVPAYQWWVGEGWGKGGEQMSGCTAQTVSKCPGERLSGEQLSALRCNCSQSLSLTAPLSAISSNLYKMK